MDVSAIVEALRGDPDVFPKKALREALRRAPESVPALLRILEETLKEARRGNLPVDAGALHAMFLLAQLREPAAYPLIVQLFSLPDTLSIDLVGDIYDHDLHRILASVSRGETAPIERMIENRKLNSLIRACAVEALRTMVLEGLVERERVVAFFRRLLDRGLDRRAPEVSDELVTSAAALHPAELMDGLRRAVAEGFPEADSVAFREAERALARDPAEVLARSRAASPGLINDAVRELSVWHDSGAFEVFKETVEPDEEDLEGEAGDEEAVETFRHAEPPPGRNDPCPCGSAKKYKKCCGRGQP